MLEIYCKEIRKKKRKKEKIRERMMLKCDATVLCKIFSENLRNQNKKNFYICFCVFFECLCQKFISVEGTGHKAASPCSFEILPTFSHFLSLKS